MSSEENAEFWHSCTHVAGSCVMPPCLPRIAASTSPYRLFSTFSPRGNWFTVLLHIFFEIFSCRCLLSSSSMTRFLSSIVVGAPRALQAATGKVPKCRRSDIVCDPTSPLTPTSHTLLTHHACDDIFISNSPKTLFIWFLCFPCELGKSEGRWAANCTSWLCEENRMEKWSENIVEKSKNGVRFACRCSVSRYKYTGSNVNILDSVSAPRLHKLI